MLKIAWSQVYEHEVPSGHRFPMAKYQLLPEQLLYEGTITAENLFEPQPISNSIALLTHTEDYLYRLQNQALSPQEIRKIGFAQSPALVHRELVIMQGTVQAAHYALQHGIAMNIAGGTHHAYTNKGEGFCLLNDQAIAANYLIHHQLVSNILVIDLDVHQGNGTAQIFANVPSVFTFSMHGANNYPLLKEKSDLDIALPDGIEDSHYLSLLDQHLPLVLDTFCPDFVFYQCGVDVLHTDKLGKLGLTIEGCKQRDRYVLELCKKHKIPVVCTMGGGYSTQIADIIEAHANTYRLAQNIWF